MSVALKDRGTDIGGLFIFSDTSGIYYEKQINLLQGIGNQIAAAANNW